MSDQHSLVAAIVIQPVQQVLDLPARHGDPHVVARDGFNGVRLVENHNVIVGKNLSPVPPQSQVREKQGVIDNQNVRVPDASSGTEVEALLVEVAVLAQAVAVFALHFVPDRTQRAKGKIGSTSVGSVVRPFQDRLELIQFFGLRIQGSRPFISAEHASQADVVGSPFDEYR